MPRWAAATVLDVRPSWPRDRVHADEGSVRPSLDACRSRPPGQPGRLAERVLWQGIVDGDHGAVGTDGRLRQSTVRSVLFYVQSRSTDTGVREFSVPLLGVSGPRTDEAIMWFCLDWVVALSSDQYFDAVGWGVVYPIAGEYTNVILYILNRWTLFVSGL